MAKNLDLNCHPEAENLLSEDVPDSRQRNPQETSSSGVPHPSHATRPQQGISTLTGDRLGSGIIDLESDEDEVKIVYYSRGFPQARSHFRRTQPVTPVLDVDSEMDQKEAGEQVARSSLNSHNNQGGSSAENECMSKMRNVMESEKVTTKEINFTCPVCMDTIVQPSSTICGHIFCLRCIKGCVQERKKCPVCGGKLNKNKFHRIYLPASE